LINTGKVFRNVADVKFGVGVQQITLFNLKQVAKIIDVQKLPQNMVELGMEKKCKKPDRIQSEYPAVTISRCQTKKAQMRLKNFGVIIDKRRCILRTTFNSRMNVHVRL